MQAAQHLKLKHIGIDTRQEHVIFMRRDCAVCRAEGFEALTRVLVSAGQRSVLATVHVVDSAILAPGEAGLSNHARQALGLAPGQAIAVTHAPTLDSLSLVRAKIFGHRLDADAFKDIIADIARGYYTDMHTAAFLAACAGGRMNEQETTDLTRAMVLAGEVIDWGRSPIADKHCVGGLPGNRTTPIVVAIVAAAGLMMPKTSSRAITSPAGTADVMETLTRVDLDIAAMRRVVEREGGCFVWGGALALSPADDFLIRVERPLDLDSDAQLVASILSKKLAAGATHVVLDIPVGPSAKVRSQEDAEYLEALMQHVAHAQGLTLRILRTLGAEPVGRGVGPALEARDVLAVLQGHKDAPQDLRARALLLAGELLELCGQSPDGTGYQRAQALLDEGSAWRKFQAICAAQGGLREPGVATIQETIVAARAGLIAEIDNRHLSRIAKLAGAPATAVAGIDLHVRRGERIAKGAPLFTIHADAPGVLAYAKDYQASHPAIDITDEA